MTADTQRPDLPKKHAQLAYDIGQGSLSMQLAAIDALDTKLGLVFGFASAVLTAPAAFLALESDSPPCATIVLLSLGGITYLVCAIFSYLAFRVRQWQFGPDLSELWMYASDNKYDEDDMKSWAAEAYKISYETNMPLWQDKGDRTTKAMIALGAESLLMTAGLITALAT